MIAESVSLGVLSLPKTLAELGLAPALVLIIGLGILATYTGYTIHQFRARYPHIQNLADAGEVLFGAFGRELFGLGQLLFSIFIMGSHILTFSVMMNTVTEHGTCTMVFTTVGFVICFVCSLPRTMKNMTYISCMCMWIRPLENGMRANYVYSLRQYSDCCADHYDWSRRSEQRWC
jgi:amino acid permease